MPPENLQMAQLSSNIFRNQSSPSIPDWAMADLPSSNKKPSIVATFIQQCLTPLQYNLIMKEKEEDMSEKQRQHWYTIETCLSLGTTNVDESMCIQFIYIYITHFNVMLCIIGIHHFI